MALLLAILGGIVFLFGIVALFVVSSLEIIALHLGAGLVLLAFAAINGAAELREIAGRQGARRGAKQGTNALVQLLGVIGILGALAFLSVRHSVRWDWTEAKVNSLAKGTLDVLEQIPEEGGVEILGFFSQGSPQGQEVEQRLALYRFASDRVRYRILDANTNPALANRFEVRTDGVIVICGGVCESSKGTVRTADGSEQEITKGIRQVISPKRKVYFLYGHGEGDPEDTSAAGYSVAKQALQDENVQVEKLLLASEGLVPKDADAVVVAGPNQGLFEQELEALDRYLRGGGSLLVLVDPIVVTNLEQRVRQWGVELRPDIVIEAQMQLFSGLSYSAQPVVTTYGTHEIARDFKGQPTLFHLARSVAPASGQNRVDEIVKTGPRSWGETDLALYTNEQQAERNPAEDTVGPLAIAVARSFPREEEAKGAEPQTPAGEEAEGAREGRLVVVGDADFARNRYVTEFANADLFLNMATWLAREEEFLTVERRRPRASMVVITPEQLASFRFVALLMLPEVILLLGIVNWWTRRR